ncbi:low molecular weight protein-tyrosine-phosphatase [Paenibacillus gansuensis]|uniref:protein-tyrosine-phosphatase n=1 Tax=Paenibacillus gansuensis TaxID=306542 RepID=A0ABW5PA88_9BACL
MVEVLFVCLGNICRSPMAEAVARSYIQSEGLSDQVKVDSAGTGDWHIGHPPHEGTRKVLDLNKISYKGMKARQFNGSDFNAFRYIVCMDRKNLRDVLERKQGETNSEVVTFMQFVPDSAAEDVPDPYYTGNFDEVYQLVQEGCRNLIHWIREKEGI